MEASLRCSAFVEACSARAESRVRRPPRKSSLGPARASERLQRCWCGPLRRDELALRGQKARHNRTGLAEGMAKDKTTLKAALFSQACECVGGCVCYCERLPADGAIAAVTLSPRRRLAAGLLSAPDCCCCCSAPSSVPIRTARCICGRRTLGGNTCECACAHVRACWLAGGHACRACACKRVCVRCMARRVHVRWRCVSLCAHVPFCCSAGGAASTRVRLLAVRSPLPPRALSRLHFCGQPIPQRSSSTQKRPWPASWLCVALRGGLGMGSTHTGWALAVWESEPWGPREPQASVPRRLELSEQCLLALL